MIISAKYEHSKINVLHAERIDGILDYTHDLRKDPSNGWTKEKTMRRVCSPPILTLMEYDRLNPGFLDVIHGKTKIDRHEREKVLKRFLRSDYAKPFMTVEKLKHE